MGNYPAATIIEAIWTIIAFYGVYISVHSWRLSQSDLEALQIAGENSLAKIAANLLKRSAVIRIVVQIMFSAVGILALLRPNLQAPNYVLTSLIVIPALLLVVSQHLDLRDRERMRRVEGR